jgi:hypothetical protein
MKKRQTEERKKKDIILIAESKLQNPSENPLLNGTTSQNSFLQPTVWSSHNLSIYKQ